MSKMRRFCIALGDYLNDPVDGFLHTMANGTWLRRIVFAVIIAFAFYWESEWRTIGWVVGLWVVYEALYYGVRFAKRMLGW